MDYGKILRRAWEITWRWKVLWLLGFLAALGNGGGGGGGTSYTSSGSDWGTGDPFLAPGIVAAIVWSVWDPTTDLDDAGIVAGLLAGVGAMAVRVVMPPSIEWFSLAGIVPDEYGAMVGMIPIPFAYDIVGHFTGKIIRGIRRRKAARESAPAS